MAKVLNETMEQLKKCSEYCENAHDRIIAASSLRGFVDTYSNTIVEKPSKKVIEIIEIAKTVVSLEKDRANEIYSNLKHADKSKSKIKSLEASATKALKSGNKKVAIEELNKLEKNGGSGLVTKILKEFSYKANYKSNAKSVFVIYSLKKIKDKKTKKNSKDKVVTATVASSVSKTSTPKKEVKATNAKVTKKTTSKATTVASLKKALKKALKKGDASAVTAYTLLASAIGKKKAKAYANKLGYSVKYKNNKPVSLNKMKEKDILNVGKDSNKDKDKNNTNNTTTTDKNENRKPSNTIDGNNNNNINSDTEDNKNDIVASVDDTNTKPEQPSTPVEDNNQTNNNNTNSSSNHYTRDEIPSENNVSVNIDTEVEGNENISDIQEGNIDNDIPTDLDDDFNELPKKENKVTTIDTDTEVEKTKKSGGLGSAIPLGLGTIATGAAAVAGVRYLKNRNESENYDDSEDYDEDTQYTDSAQYASEEDEYSGPAGSVYTDVSENSVDDLYTENELEESYIDPDNLEEDNDDDFSNDKAFEEINSNFN